MLVLTLHSSARYADESADVFCNLRIMLRPTADDDELRNNMAAADMMVSILTTVAVCEDVSMHCRLQRL